MSLGGKAMPKRLTATEVWDKQWFRKLPPKMKCFWKFLCDRCDIAGVWDADFDQASFMIGEAIDASDMEAFGERVVMLDEGHWHLTTFIEFQYKNSLKSTVRPQKAVIDKLSKHSLTERYAYCIDTVLDKDKDKDKDMDKDKYKDILESLGCFTEALLETYLNFAESRIENKHKKLTERGMRMQIKDMLGRGFSEGSMISCINSSASNGWQGLYPDKIKPATPEEEEYDEILPDGDL